MERRAAAPVGSVDGRAAREEQVDARRVPPLRRRRQRRVRGVVDLDAASRHLGEHACVKLRDRGEAVMKMRSTAEGAVPPLCALLPAHTAEA